MILRLISSLIILSFFLQAQIYKPEGVNMPGAWNSWTNPPATGSVFGNQFQVTSGKITRDTTGTMRWHTTINVQSSGGDITEGTYAFLFTSGPSGGAFNNKWAGVTISMNTLQSYTFNSGSDNSITVSNGKYYTVNFKDNGYAGTQAIFMETSAQPVTITGVTNNFSERGSGNDGSVTITLSGEKSAEEHIFVRYTTDGWNTSSFVEATGSGTTYSASIPDAVITGENGNDQYYVMTTTIASPTHADVDMQTINYNNNNGANYRLPVVLQSFVATVNGKQVRLNWSTATEQENAGFEVQKKNGTGWTALGFVAGNGTTSQQHAYSFTDQTATVGTASYRLKQVDRDGKFEYSPVIEAAVTLAPGVTELGQNYPNPFNPTTSISFTVSNRQPVRLAVYDLIGREIAVLLNGVVEPNVRHDVPFNASTLGSGVYLYKLTTGSGSLVRKMTVLK